MATLAEQIVALASLLSPEKQQQVLEFMQELATKKAPSKPELPPGTPVSALLNVHFSMSAEEADAMWHAMPLWKTVSEVLMTTKPVIMGNCEKVQQKEQ